ncbi:MAG: UvrD-helicase domain-containing protein, partial [bacterium]
AAKKKVRIEALHDSINLHEKALRDRINLRDNYENIIRDSPKLIQSDDFISHHQLESWISTYTHALTKIRELNEEQRATFLTSIRMERTQFEICTSILRAPEEWRKTHNSEFINRKDESCRHYLFKEIGLNLNTKQTESVLTNDNRVLVVAGAGTGKTTTIIAKVAWLINTRWCKPEEILLLSFSKRTVSELKEKLDDLGIQGVEIKTYHGFGNQVLKTVRNNRPNVSALTRQKISNYLMEIQNEGSSAANSLVEFLVYYPTPYDPTGNDQKENKSERLVAIDGNQVRSEQELKIMDWLWAHNIEVEYEREYDGFKDPPSSDRQYKPDFYLTEYNIWIEHYGINRDGNTKSGIDPDEYKSQMEWKRQTHKSNETTCLETFSYQFTEDTIYSLLKSELLSHGVPIKRKSNEEIVLHKEMQARFKEASVLFFTTLQLYREGLQTLDQLEKRLTLGEEETNLFSNKTRHRKFLSVFSRLVVLYENHLKSEEQIDYADMIKCATAHISSNQYKSNYRVVMVDEFQDISMGRALLLNELVLQKPDMRLFCVGDDWQSIYRFNGADVMLMINFQTQWTQAVRITLNQTYRLKKRLQDISTDFISKNPLQLSKELNADDDDNIP